MEDGYEGFRSAIGEDSCFWPRARPLGASEVPATLTTAATQATASTALIPDSAEGLDNEVLAFLPPTDSADDGGIAVAVDDSLTAQLPSAPPLPSASCTCSRCLWYQVCLPLHEVHTNSGSSAVRRFLRRIRYHNACAGLLDMAAEPPFPRNGIMSLPRSDVPRVLALLSQVRTLPWGAIKNSDRAKKLGPRPQALLERWTSDHSTTGAAVQAGDLVGFETNSPPVPLQSRSCTGAPAFY